MQAHPQWAASHSPTPWSDISDPCRPIHSGQHLTVKHHGLTYLTHAGPSSGQHPTVQHHGLTYLTHAGPSTVGSIPQSNTMVWHIWPMQAHPQWAASHSPTPWSDISDPSTVGSISQSNTMAWHIWPIHSGQHPTVQHHGLTYQTHAGPSTVGSIPQSNTMVGHIWPMQAHPHWAASHSPAPWPDISDPSTVGSIPQSNTMVWHIWPMPTHPVGSIPQSNTMVWHIWPMQAHPHWAASHSPTPLSNISDPRRPIQWAAPHSPTPWSDISDPCRPIHSRQHPTVQHHGLTYQTHAGPSTVGSIPQSNTIVWHIWPMQAHPQWAASHSPTPWSDISDPCRPIHSGQHPTVQHHGLTYLTHTCPSTVGSIPQSNTLVWHIWPMQAHPQRILDQHRPIHSGQHPMVQHLGLTYWIHAGPSTVSSIPQSNTTVWHIAGIWRLTSFMLSVWQLGRLQLSWHPLIQCKSQMLAAAKKKKERSDPL